MSKLELRGVEKAFSGTPVLRGIDLVVEDGELCVILGPSGCGKSTLLRCVAGLEAADAGEILVDGTRVNDFDPKRRNVAMVFQTYALYPHKTVRENLAFPLRMRRRPREETARRVAEAAALLRIEPLLDRKPRSLSGGQRQRVAMGRALVREPSLFLFDEPLSNLDAQLRNEMRAEIVRLHGRLKTTTLYVTHDQVEAMTLGERIVVLRDGAIEQVGTPQEVYDSPATLFVAGFLGAVPMNLMEGRVAGGTFSAPGIGGFGAAGVPDGAAVCGVRPEDVRLGEGADRARVEWIENRGADSYAHLRAGDLVLACRVSPADSPKPGSEVAFTFDPSRTHFFRHGVRVAG